MRLPVFFTVAALAGALAAQEVAPAVQASPAEAKVAPQPDLKSFVVETGTRIPLSMVNSVSTKTTGEGDRVYLETSFPIAVNGKIVIPAGSYVLGTVTSSKRPGKVKGRGEFRLRFDSLMLPNGVTRDFRAQVAGLDGRAAEDLDKKEGTIRSEGNKSGDARVIGETATTGAAVGGLAGIGRAPALGAGIGAAAGATAALIGVLVTRGPDAVLAKGTTVEMILDRQLIYEEGELNFSNLPPRYSSSEGGGPLPSRKSQGTTRRFP
jgi:type IV secretion system protein VirB10